MPDYAASLAAHDHQMWVETLFSFGRSFKAWLPWGLGCSALTFGFWWIGGVSFAPRSFLGIGDAVLVLTQLYLWTFFYLKRHHGNFPSPQGNVIHYGRCLGTYVLAGIIVALPVILCLGAIMVGFFTLAEVLFSLAQKSRDALVHYGLGLWLGYALLLLNILWLPTFFSVLFLGLRFILVLPLAVARFPKEIRTSWVLTRGAFWRLSGNVVMLVLVVGAVYALIAFLGMLALDIGDANDDGFYKTTSFFGLLISHFGINTGTLLRVLKIFFLVCTQTVLCSLFAALSVEAILRLAAAHKIRNPSFVLQPLLR